jgi:uncharacterized glyoxalase superfamily protein PhnB
VQSLGVERIDGECAVTTLRATDAAGKVRTGASRGFGEVRVNDLHELGIAGREFHTSRIAKTAVSPYSGRGGSLMAQNRSTVIPALRYRNAPAMIDWLTKVFGFERHAVHEGPAGTIAHAEIVLNGGMIMLGSMKDDEYGRGFKSPAELDGAETRSVYIVVSDADAAYKHATGAGATVVRPLQDTPYGSREFAIKDPEGHSWSAGTYDPWAAHE